MELAAAGDGFRIEWRWCRLVLERGIMGGVAEGRKKTRERGKTDRLQVQ